MKPKGRLSASVDAELLEAARVAVADGRAESVSAWVNEALQRQRDHDRRLQALDEFIAGFEAEHGPITEEEMRAAGRKARSRAVVVRDPAPPPPARRRRGAA